MSIKKYKQPEQSQFVPVGHVVENIFKGGSYSLTLGYVDHAGAIKDNVFKDGQIGRYVEYITNKNDKGRDNAKRFKFDQSLGRLLTRPTDVDIYGKSQYAFLKNHPECEGSPNGFYETDNKGNKKQTGVTFRELNAAQDAKVALEAIKLVNKAESQALTLDEKTLAEVANVIGYFGPVDEMMALKVQEFAKKLPSDFLQIMKAEDRRHRAVIRKALDEGIFREQGKVIKWENLVIGSNEDNAVSFLLDKKNENVLKSIEDELTKRANK